jgi:hypothetical protein
MHPAGVKGLTLSMSERRHSAERQQKNCVGWEATGIDRFATLFRLRFVTHSEGEPFIECGPGILKRPSV